MSGTDCALARESISANLDGELNELDLHRLHAHLRTCADCSAWAELVKATTTQLREARLEAPAAAVELPRRGRTRRVSPAFAAVPVAALAAVVVISLAGAQHRPLDGQPTTSTSLRSPEHSGSNRPGVGADEPAVRHWAPHAI